MHVGNYKIYISHSINLYKAFYVLTIVSVLVDKKNEGIIIRAQILGFIISYTST